MALFVPDGDADSVRNYAWGNISDINECISIENILVNKIVDKSIVGIFLGLFVVESVLI